MLQGFCRMMNERVPMKDLALRKRSMDAIIIQIESSWNLPRALTLSMSWAAWMGTRGSLGDEER